MNSVESVGKRVGFLELFFDLVFVFAVTQLVGLLHEDHSAAGWGRAALMMWLVWWAWSLFAWAGNAIDLDDRPTRVAMLAVTGAMLIAAAAIPIAEHDGGLWFAVPYALVRLGGLGLYWAGLAGDSEHRAALLTFLPVALVSAALILAGGFAQGSAQTAWWCAAVAVDLFALWSAGRGEFRVDPAHFAERHGLIVIIALGESVVAIGATATEVGLSASVVLVVVASLASVAGLWWCYFDWVHAAAEARLAGEQDHRRRGNLARDLFTLAHLPIVAGTVVLAAAAEEALVHPDEPLGDFASTALVIGPAIYLAGFVIGNWRATGELLTTRVIGIAVVVGVGWLAGPNVRPAISSGLLALAIASIAIAETRRTGAGGVQH
jgi:low temperature requirement protein LtrA